MPYVIAQHRILDPEKAFPRGKKLLRAEGAPAGARNLQFYPAQDGSAVTCLWEAPSAAEIQRYVDATLGDASENTCYEIDPEQSFSHLPSGLGEAARQPN
jgi:hypothetical protein